MDELQPITNVLDEYQSNKLFSLDLRRDLIGQDPSFDTYQEIDDNGDLPEDVKQMEIEVLLLGRTIQLGRGCRKRKVYC